MLRFRGLIGLITGQLAGHLGIDPGEEGTSERRHLGFNNGTGGLHRLAHHLVVLIVPVQTVTDHLHFISRHGIAVLQLQGVVVESHGILVDVIKSKLLVNVSEDDTEDLQEQHVKVTTHRVQRGPTQDFHVVLGEIEHLIDLLGAVVDGPRVLADDLIQGQVLKHRITSARFRVPNTFSCDQAISGLTTLIPDVVTFHHLDVHNTDAAVHNFLERQIGSRVVRRQVVPDSSRQALDGELVDICALSIWGRPRLVWLESSCNSSLHVKELSHRITGHSILEGVFTLMSQLCVVVHRSEV
mmetsp:Transcript_137156/g.238522  ORF Transcript_137156/g.238522 Transcript_137156/m.238522 type:complete len:298 (-) Transcript_137156:1440-2333(-)